MTSSAAAAKAPRENRFPYPVSRFPIRPAIPVQRSRAGSMLLGRVAVAAESDRSSVTAARHPAHSARWASSDARSGAASSPSTYSLSFASMCPHMEAKLNEYVDGALAAPDRASLEAHLAECAGCRAAVTELRSLSAATATLPRSIEPARDLWTGIAGRIGKRETGYGKRFSRG